MSAATGLETDPTNLPSTSTGTCCSSTLRKPVLSNSSSSDSETEDVETLFRRKDTSSSPVGNANSEGKEKQEGKRPYNDGCEAGPSCAHRKEPLKHNGVSNPLKRKGGEGRTTPPKHKFNDIQSSSDSDNTDTDSPKSKVHARKSSSSRCQEKKIQKENGTTSISSNTQTSVGNENEPELSAPNEEAGNEPRQDTSQQQLPEPTFTRQLEAITGRLDHLMFLQRNALDSSQRNRDGESQDNSPLRNSG